MEENQQIPIQNVENQGRLKKKKILLIIIILIALIASISLVFFKINRSNQNIKDDPSIERYAIQTGSGYNEIVPVIKYRINSNDELDAFCKMYGGFKLKNNYDLTKNTIFIETDVCGSGSVKCELEKVSIKEKVEFGIKIDNPKNGGTMDIAYWYFVAIIPNEKLQGVNIDDWVTPIFARDKYIKNEYRCYVESTDLSNLRNIREKINEIGNIKISYYNYYNEDKQHYYEYSEYDYKVFLFHAKTHSYTLISYDENSINKLVEYINNNELGVSVVGIEEHGMSNKDYNEKIESFNTQNNLLEPKYEIRVHFYFMYMYNHEKEVIERLNLLLIPDNIETDKRESGTIVLSYNDLTPSELLEKIELISNNYENWERFEEFYVEGLFN